jgi:hypothetical protein
VLVKLGEEEEEEVEVEGQAKKEAAVEVLERWATMSTSARRSCR